MTTLTGAHRKRMVPGGLRSSTSGESGLPWNWNRIKPASTPACPTQSKDQETSAHFFPAEPGRNGHQHREEIEREFINWAGSKTVDHDLAAQVLGIRWVQLRAIGQTC